MNNSYLVGTGECLGYCSIVPNVNEEHMFGEQLVKFSYSIGELLFFTGQHYPDPTIENNFKYHAPKEWQPETYHMLREGAKEFAYMIAENCPNSREKSLALTNLEQAVFWANAGISRN